MDCQFQGQQCPSPAAMDQLIQRDGLLQNPPTPSSSSSVVPCVELPGHPIRSQSSSRSVQESAISICFDHPVELVWFFSSLPFISVVSCSPSVVHLPTTKRRCNFLLLILCLRAILFLCDYGNGFYFGNFDFRGKLSQSATINIPIG